MKKWKDIPSNEKWMAALILVLLLGILLRWSDVKNGISRGFKWYNDDTEEVLPTNAVPDEPGTLFPVEIVE